jgi:hypothetical protein
MFFHKDFIKEFRSFIYSWSSVIIAIIVNIIKGVGDNKGEKQLLIINEEGEFDENDFGLSNNFRTKYEQLFEAILEAIVEFFNQECDNNNKRRLIFEGTTLHNFNKGYG